MKRLPLLAMVATLLVAGSAYAQSLADATANPSLKPQHQVFPFVWNGATWDRLYGDATNGLYANIKTVVPGTGATNLGKAEDAGHTTGDTGVPMFAVRKDGAAQVTSADADYSQVSVDAYGAVYSRSDHPNRIRCTVIVSTATTTQAVGGSCAAPGAGLSIYITDVSFGTSAAAGTAADSFPTLKSGTGGTCGTGTAVFWQALTAANTTVTENLTTPIKVPANSEVCWIMTTAGSKTLQINGYVAP